MQIDSFETNSFWVIYKTVFQFVRFAALRCIVVVKSFFFSFLLLLYTHIAAISSSKRLGLPCRLLGSTFFFCCTCSCFRFGIMLLLSFFALTKPNNYHILCNRSRRPSPDPTTHAHTLICKRTMPIYLSLSIFYRASNWISRFVRTLYKIRNPQCRHRTGSPFFMRFRTPQSPQRYSTPLINGIAPVVVVVAPVVVAPPATDAAPPGVFIIQSRCCLSCIVVSFFLFGDMLIAGSDG
mmetsp:Transcript_38496/g.93310  ORF Transcript_38496/g.93310 Transcript_38496/m.93310 type:complete len:237 (+) Transcript_38496:1317-2027(+)